MITIRSGVCRPGTLRNLSVAVFACLMFVSIAYAQRPKTPPSSKKAEDEKAPAAKKGDTQKRDTGRGNADDRTEPQLVNLQSDDGVLISATYFPPLRPSKDVAPVILLHGLGEKESIFFPTKTEHDLAFALQDHGYAVLTFDFRGHGHSTRRVGTVQGAETKGAAGNKLDFHDLHTAAQFSTLLNDIETAKRFLLQKNNAGELNIGKLAVVGTEMGASLAVIWAFRDWQYPAQAGFSGKQGQDVQALVLVSPQYNFKGISINNELSFIQKRIPIQVVVGKKDARTYADAKKIYQSSVKARPTETDSKLTELDTSQIAGKLLNPDLELDVEKEIAGFLDSTVKRLRPEWGKRELADGDKAGS